MKPVHARGDSRTMRTLRRLRQEAHSDKEPRVALRIQGLMLSLEKRTCGEVADLLHVSRSRVHAWVSSWNEFGLEGIKEGHRSGRPRALNDDQLLQLRDIIESGPLAYGLPSGVWTSLIITKVITNEFQVTYHPGHVRKLLRGIGMSVQRPTTHLALADPRLQRKWVRYTYPNLKKKPKRKGPR